jgi:hypothetical protein
VTSSGWFADSETVAPFSEAGGGTAGAADVVAVFLTVPVLDVLDVEAP